ncbi:MAG: ASKHA domain-containing protein [Planctomycetia bacterium]|nr:ASKHA domain-containing protein [Planctomycetia bacterium]
MKKYMITCYSPTVEYVDRMQWIGTFESEPDITLAAFFDRIRYPLRRDCGGLGLCGKCQVAIAHGNTLPENLLFEDVCACQKVIDSDLVVVLPPPVVQNETPKKSRLGKQPVKRGSGRFVVAVDLGTTTIVLALVDLVSHDILVTVRKRNPQAAIGNDVISRIQYASRGPEYLLRAQTFAIQAISELIEEACYHVGGKPENVEKIVVAGNTVMSYLFYGINPEAIGKWPFVPPQKEFPARPAVSLGIKATPKAIVSLLPAVTGFVGGDIISGLLAIAPKRSATELLASRSSLLFIDIGTNGEMVLLQGGRLLVAATAAGPAFEGAQIRCGMIGQRGAIDGVDYSPVPYWAGDKKAATGPLSIVGNVPPVGICGSGLVDAIAEMYRNGLVSSRGRLAGQSDRLPALEMFEDRMAFPLSKEHKIWITQRDIRQIQLAVAAIQAGTRLLMEHCGIDLSRLNRIRLAGAFGSALRRENARQIGLLPLNFPIDGIRYCGNTSLAGAIAAALDPRLFIDAAVLANKAENVDLATLPHFQDVFVDAMNFPPIQNK